LSQNDQQIPQQTLSEIYAIDELDLNDNYDSFLTLNLVKAEQDKDKKLQKILTEQNTRKISEQ
jgi:hypothetical protein